MHPEAIKLFCKLFSYHEILFNAEYIPKKNQFNLICADLKIVAPILNREPKNIVLKN